MSPGPPHAPQTGEIAFTATLEVGGKTANGIELPETRQRRIAEAVAQLSDGRR